MLATRSPVLFNKKQTKEEMPFTLTMSNGKEMQFYLEATARLYRNLYGGQITKKSF